MQAAVCAKAGNRKGESSTYWDRPQVSIVHEPILKQPCHVDLAKRPREIYESEPPIQSLRYVTPVSSRGTKSRRENLKMSSDHAKKGYYETRQE